MPRFILKMVGIVIFGIIASLPAQVHFKFTANTGSNASLAIPNSANPTIMSAPLVAGDEIAVYTPDGLCAGATVWQPNQNAVITVWGDNDQTPEIDGMRAGEQMQFCVWQKSSNSGYGDVSVGYSSGNATFAANGIYVLSSLSANAMVAPLPPPLAAPPDAVSGITSTPRLSWYPACSAVTYRLQVSTMTDFSTLVLDQGNIDSLLYDFTGVVSNTTYYWRVAGVNSLGTSDWSAARRLTTGTITGIDEEIVGRPIAFTLSQNFPNPVNPTTEIRFTLPAATHVALQIFNTLGQQIRTLVDAPHPAGERAVQWDGKDDSGKPAASGVYLYRVQAGGISLTRRLTLLR